MASRLQRSAQDPIRKLSRLIITELLSQVAVDGTRTFTRLHARDVSHSAGSFLSLCLTRLCLGDRFNLDTHSLTAFDWSKRMQQLNLALAGINNPGNQKFPVRCVRNTQLLTHKSVSAIQ